MLSELYNFAIQKKSLLLGISFLGVWTLCVVLFSKHLPNDFRKNILHTLGCIIIVFLCTLFYLPESNALNFALSIGCAGFSVPFAFAISALLTGRADVAWARWARPWTLMTWCFLTLGILMSGSFVGNMSLMPWLSGTALIHSLIVSEKRNTFHHWAILLAITTFLLSVFCAFSVNLFLYIVMGGALLIYVLRANKIKSEYKFAFLSRENFLLFNNILLLVAVAVLLMSPRFNFMFAPLSMVILFCMGLGPLCHWGNMPWEKLKTPLMINLGLSIIFGFFISVSAAFALFAMSAIFRHMWQTRKTIPSPSRLGMWLAHIGMGICVIGISINHLSIIWAGGILIFLGGLSSALSRKYYR